MSCELVERIDTELKAAMRAGDQKLRVSTLRLILAAVKDRDIAARSNDRCSGMTDDDVLEILSKMVKQREESAQTYEDAGRVELAEQERQEISIVREFMPRQMSEEEVQTAVDDVIADIGAVGLKDMGKCMSALKERHAGAMDFSLANRKVKERLG